MVLKQLFGKKPEQKQETQQKQADNPAAAEAQQAEPVVARELELAMVENARNDSRDTRNRVYQELLFSDLLLALSENKDGTEPNPNELNVAILSNPQDVKFAAAFTSAEAARRWRPEGGNYATIRGQDLYRLLEPSPAEVLVINPGSAPMIVLPKIEYRQLAAGVIPQTQHTPVQVPSADGQQQQQQPQIIFDANVFDAPLREKLAEILRGTPNVDAVAVAFMVPPGGDPNKDRQRTVFLRTKDVDQTQESMQSFFEQNLQPRMAENDALFRSSPFQFMPILDPSFWVAVHRHKAALFDNNPPEIPEEVGFRPDAFNDEQKAIIEKVLRGETRILAASIGGVLPPEADPRSGWVRTVFVRVNDLDFSDADAVNTFFNTLHGNVMSHQNVFKDVAFTFRVMSDPNFWVSAHQHQTVVYDMDPPPAQVEMAFPPDVMSDQQKDLVRNILEAQGSVEAASIGAILPPGADKQKGWIRTVFVRANGIGDTQEAVQTYCSQLRDTIRDSDGELFRETGFEVGLMPDPSFWDAMHKNNLVLFDKNPPAAHV